MSAAGARAAVKQLHSFLTLVLSVCCEPLLPLQVYGGLCWAGKLEEFDFQRGWQVFQVLGH